MKKIKKIFLLFAGVCVLSSMSSRALEEPSKAQYEKMLKDALKTAGLQGGATSGWEARLRKISGTVQIKAEGSSQWRQVEGLFPVESGDIIKILDGSAELYLDGCCAAVLGRSTEMEFSSFDKAGAVFKLKSGSFIAKMKAFTSDKNKMEIVTPSATAAVRGTEFGVDYSALSKETSAAVFEEGRLIVSPKDEKGQALGEYTLEKNTELIFPPSQKRFKPIPLARMMRYRPAILSMRKRADGLAAWKPAGEERRKELRERVLNPESAVLKAEKKKSAAVKTRRLDDKPLKTKKPVTKAGRKKRDNSYD